MKKGSTNINLRKLVSELNKNKKDIWKRVARDLEKSRRSRRTVNLSRINRYSNDGDIVVIPGKVLADGTIEKKVSIAAFHFSTAAKSKIETAGGKAISIQELLKTNPDAKGVKILG